MASLAQVRNELTGLTFITKNGPHVPGASVIPHSLQNDLSIEGNILILLGFTVVTRVLAFFLTEAAARYRFL